MLIIGADFRQAELTKALLPSSFAMKDIGEVDVILEI